MINTKIPELLAPAGSYDAFVAAVASGADAVYLGGSNHNARIGAKNFTEEELRRAIDEAHTLGRRIYITLNTLVSDRELEQVLDSAESLMSIGADAFIVQDLGLMRALSLALPEAELHASTQCITHSLDGVRTLERLGAKRCVVARELDREGIAKICREANSEIEVFVHGALCVCHSGACLFSSLVGGRSGNRGECAQPCRLPYNIKSCDSEYPLSLCDLTLSGYLTELAEMGVASLKVEGRMKSPEYVGRVIRIFRELIDMGRNADKSDLEALARIFSRGGFTDGYYTGKLGRKMFGVRSAEDKEATRGLASERFALPKAPLDADMTVSAEGVSLTLKANGVASTAVLPPPDIAVSRPLDSEAAREQTAKLGQTPFYLNSFDFNSDGGYIVPKSALNALRRQALEGLFVRPTVERHSLDKIESLAPRHCERYAVFAPHRREKSIPDGVDRAYFPIFKVPVFSDKAGVALPTVIKDSERNEVKRELERLRGLGVGYAFSESLGGVALALECGFKVIAGMRINAYNSQTLKTLSELGVEGAVMSSELTAPMKRDMKKPLPVGEVIYGRVPLMLMENCVMNLRDGCRDCSDFKECKKSAELIDRKGVSFPVFPEYYHRCQIYNSVVTYNADKPSSNASFGIIYITDELSAQETVKKIISGKIPESYTRKG